VFEHYVESVRRAILFARHEAIQGGCPEITPEHILLGLLREDTATAGILPEVSVQQIRDEVSAYLVLHKEQSHAVQTPLSKAAEQVLTIAEEETKRLAQLRVTTNHILLGLLQLEGSFAGQSLRRNGLSAEYIRERSLAVDAGRTEETGSEVSDVAAKQSPADRRQYELEARVIDLLRLNDFDGALRVVNEALSDPSLDQVQTTRTLALVASQISRISGNLDLAMRYSERLLACSPNNAMAIYVLADCLALQGRTGEAEEWAYQSYRLCLEQTDAHNRSLAELIEHRFPRSKSKR